VTPNARKNNGIPAAIHGYQAVEARSAAVMLCAGPRTPTVTVTNGGTVTTAMSCPNRLWDRRRAATRRSMLGGSAMSDFAASRCARLIQLFRWNRLMSAMTLYIMP